MRKFVIVISGLVLAMASTGAFAECCKGPTFNSDSAGAAGGGFAKNAAIAVSKSHGNGYAQNNAYSASNVAIRGYANDQAKNGSNGYQAGINVTTDTSTAAGSLNKGTGTGFAAAVSVAGAAGVAGGKASSHTHDGECGHSGPKVSKAYALGGGIVAAGSASLSVTGGKNANVWASNASGAEAGIDLWGKAGTNGNKFWAKAKDEKYAETYSVSSNFRWTNPTKDSKGFSINGGIGGAAALGGGVAGGYVYD